MRWPVEPTSGLILQHWAWRCWWRVRGDDQSARLLSVERCNERRWDKCVGLSEQRPAPAVMGARPALEHVEPGPHGRETRLSCPVGERFTSDSVDLNSHRTNSQFPRSGLLARECRNKLYRWRLGVSGRGKSSDRSPERAGCLNACDNSPTATDAGRSRGRRLHFSDCVA